MSLISGYTKVSNRLHRLWLGARQQNAIPLAVFVDEMIYYYPTKGEILNAGSRSEISCIVFQT